MIGEGDGVKLNEYTLKGSSITSFRKITLAGAAAAIAHSLRILILSICVLRYVHASKFIAAHGYARLDKPPAVIPAWLYWSW